MSNSAGKAIIFSAPSGSGKTTIVRHLLEHADLPLGFSVSATTRAPRGTERHGVDYYFLTLEDFERCSEAGDFLEWEEVYPGIRYGTLRSELQRHAEAGRAVLFDVDVVGGLRLRTLLGDQALAIFVRTPTLEILQERLERRGTDSAESIAVRVEKAAREWRYADQFDVQIVNDDLATACTEATQVVAAFLAR
jgi:guanylate kinase